MIAIMRTHPDMYPVHGAAPRCYGSLRALMLYALEHLVTVFLFGLRFVLIGYCFKKCVSDKRKKSTDFLDLQEIKTTKTKKV